MNLIPDEIKSAAQGLVHDMHETFGRDIVIYKESQQVIISTNPAHNFIFGSAPTNTQVTNTVVSGTFRARILYGRSQTKQELNSTNTSQTNDQINVSIPDGTVRIKLDPTGAAYLKDATRVTFDGQIFDIDTFQRPHGLFEPQFETFLLKRIN